jgi:hypothetical protein
LGAIATLKASKLTSFRERRMKPIVWKMTIIGITAFSLLQAVPQAVAAFNAASQSEQPQANQSSATVMNVATGGANLRVRSTPNGDQFVMCLDDETPIMVTQYSSDRQWVFVASQQSATGNWSPVHGWVRTQYITSVQP